MVMGDRKIACTLLIRSTARTCTQYHVHVLRTTAVYTGTVCIHTHTRFFSTTGPLLNSTPLFLFLPKTNRKFLCLPNLAQNWAEFAILKC
jgi:hypothetical protein